MHCVLVGSINSMASAMRGVETRLDSLESKVDSFQRGVNARLDDHSKQLLGIKSHLENVTRGLGFSMESYSAAWLIELLRSRGIQNPEGKVCF